MLNGFKSFRALCPLFSVCFSILIISLGEERAGLCASRTFVCFARVCFCAFSLPLGVEAWLWFVTMAYPVPFLLTFYILYLVWLEWVCSTV